MAKSIFSAIAIRGLAGAVPVQRVNNLTDHAFCPEEESKKIIQLTGVREYRKTSPGVCSSDLCEASARKLLHDLGRDPSSIDGIVFATMTPDYRIPSTACLLQDRLGCSKSTVAYDINMGCSGFVVGLYNACSLIQGGGLQSVLLLTGDTQTKLCHEQDKNVVFLLGDGGSACLLERTHSPNDRIDIELFTDGSRFDKLFIPAGGFRNPSSESTRKVEPKIDGGTRSDDNIFMDGMEIFKFSSTDVVASIQNFMTARGACVEDYDLLVLHQANKFMTDKIARKLKFPLEKVPYSLDVFGNTASASIPLTIVHNYGDKIAPGKKRCLLSGFGVGLSWGIVDVTLDRIYCPPVIEYSNAVDG